MKALIQEERLVTDRAPRPATDPEADLIVRHRDGDPSAFVALVERYRRPVWSYLRRCGVEESAREDLFQDVFVKVHRAAAGFDAERAGHPWIFTIVANTVRNHQRRRRVRQLIRLASETTAPGDDAEPEAPDPSPDAEQRSVLRQTLRLVEAELARLRPIERQVVLLACVEKLPQADIAAALEVPVGTVKTHLRRARLALARALAGHGVRADDVTPIGGRP